MPKPTKSRLWSSFGFATASASAVLTPAGALAGGRPGIIATDSDRDADAERDLERPSEEPDAHAGPASIGRSLALALRELSPWSATEVAATWACSPEPSQRRAIIEALGWPFWLVGDDIVIDHLSRDPDPAIRIAAARAAWARRWTGGDDGVLARLAEDSTPAVRRLAQLAMSR